MGSGFSKKKKQAKLFQQQISKMQEQMEHAEAEGTSGNGLVSVVLTGDHEIKSIRIKAECVDPDDVEGLEDLIKAAHNDAVKKLKNSLSGGMPSLGF
ncbi:MAG: YbaB/EbfC family nucleoid-associated protein [Chlamydiales bacterium]